MKEKLSEGLKSKTTVKNTSFAENLENVESVLTLLLSLIASGLIIIGLYIYYQNHDTITLLILGLFIVILLSISANWRRVKISIFKGEVELEK